MNVKYLVVAPQAAYAQAFAKAYADYQQANEQKWIDFYLPGIKNFSAYTKELSDLEKGINLLQGWVPESTRWLIDEQQEIVGFTRLRHSLTPFLEEAIGHIGYDIPPSCRKRGYGHECLKVAIALAKNIGLLRVLLTCDSDNIASKRVIEKAGAKLENEIVPAGQSHLVSRYWLEI